MWDLALEDLQTLLVPPWHYLVAVAEPELELANCHHLILWEIFLQKGKRTTGVSCQRAVRHVFTVAQQ